MRVCELCEREMPPPRSFDGPGGHLPSDYSVKTHCYGCGQEFTPEMIEELKEMVEDW